jgi:hypothetical protein
VLEVESTIGSAVLDEFSKLLAVNDTVPVAATFAVVSAIPTRGVFQTDGWGETRTAFTYAAYTRGWGRGNHVAETRFLGIYYHDWRHLVKTDARPLAVRRADLANIRISTFGGHHLSAFTSQAGTADILLWGVAQTGRWLVGRGEVPEAELKNVAKEFTADELTRWSTASDTPVGRLSHLKPVVQMSQTPTRWARPSVPLGYNDPVWPARA